MSFTADGRGGRIRTDKFGFGDRQFRPVELTPLFQRPIKNSRLSESLVVQQRTQTLNTRFPK